MIDQYLALFGLNSDAVLSDVKKAYRKLAKENHPDRFTDELLKIEQEKRMVVINEAYHFILNDFKERINKGKSEPLKNKPKAETDYEIYKKGFDSYSRYNRAHRTEEKVKHLKQARNYFMRLLKEYPDSDWSDDAEEKLKVIGSIGESFIESHFEYSQKRSPGLK
jgi:curved DNA-binding protein CbpA